MKEDTKKAAAADSAAAGFVEYVTKEPFNMTFEIMLKGQLLRGEWLGDGDGRRVLFKVPAEHQAVFESSYHFDSGFLVRR